MGMHGIAAVPSIAANQHDAALDMAGKMVDHFMQKDSTYPPLLETLHLPGYAEPSVSGLQDADYPDLSATSAGLGILTEPNVASRVPLPAELVEQFGHMQCNCMMGLFPEIGRAWLTIDSDIFVWTYSNSGDLAYFNGLNETILSVCLVKPKPGIFRSHIHYLLCLATPVEIVLLGVSFSKVNEDESVDYGNCEMHLLPEPLFAVPSDNTFFLTIASSSNGRIFMGSKDGCLYELVYQAVDGWFSRKCRKVNHSSGPLSFLVPSFLNLAFSEDPIIQIAIDNTRHILYTRSEKGTLQVFDLGSNGKSTSRVISMSEQNVMRYATMIARTIDRSNFKSIVHVAAVENTESVHVHLVAVTQAGVRLYFTTAMSGSMQNSGRPNKLHLLHIRLPPGFAANASPHRPSRVHMAHYRKGIFLLVASQTEENDALWLISADTFPFQQQLMETQGIISLDGRVWAMAELTETEKELSPMRQTVSPLSPPLVVVQHREVPRQFLLLTPQGIHIVTQLRPVDRLRQMLVENQGPECEAVKTFFLLHQEEQACATCLILACSNIPQDKQVADWATRAFFLYGGEPRFKYPTSHVGSTETPSYSFSSPLSPIGHRQVMSTPASPTTGQSAYVQQQMDQSMYLSSPNRSMTVPSSSPIGPEMLYSGKHNGLYLYFGRILRPLWDLFVVREVPLQTQQGLVKYLSCTMTCSEFDWYLNHIASLKEFVEKFAQVKVPAATEGQNLSQRVRNFILPESLPSGDVSQLQQQLQKKSQIEAQLQERSSLVQLQQLMIRVSEVLGLCKVLVDHQFQAITASLSRDSQNQLKSMTFRDLIINGKEISGMLVTSLINRYLCDNTTTDSISGRLQDVCPSIYKTEDAVSAKTIEMLLNARQVQNVQEKDQLLQEALRLAKQIPLRLNIPLICSYFQAVHFYSAIVELCLNVAAKIDPQGIALQYYRNGEPTDDQQGVHVFVQRMECYKVILDTLGQLAESSLVHPKSPSIPKLPGPPPSPDPNMLSPAEAGKHFEMMFQLVLKSTDELCHVALYDWLLERKWVEKLLEIQEVSLQNYLKRSVTVHPDSRPVLDLLWKYYEKSGNYSAAARILVKLAERHGADFPLVERIECLSRAAICIKSSAARSTLSSEGAFLQELEEKIEVARIQLQILQTLQQPPQSQSTVLSQLNSELMDITRLYEDFAEPFHLAESKLAIVHCANHSDPALIESLWQEIIDKEFAAVANLSPATIMSAVGKKLTTLGRIYNTSHKFFPLVFLVRILEQKSAVLNLEQGWVFTILQSIGVPFTMLFNVYDKLYKAKDPIWPSLRKPLHLLQVLDKLIESFIVSPRGSQQEKRQIVNICLDCLARYLVDLQVLGPSVNENVSQLMCEFKSSQSKLERLV